MEQEKDAIKCDLPIHSVIVTSSSFVTYCAVLCYLRTSYINFLPLSSAAPPRPKPVTPTSAATSARGPATHPVFSATERLPFGSPSSDSSSSTPSASPTPVSPKSVYRLAHLLEHAGLQKLCLNQISSALTVNNVASELFGDVAKAYPDVYKLEMHYVVKNWASVQKSSAMKEIESLVEKDELPGGGKVLLDLARRLRT